MATSKIQYSTGSRRTFMVHFILLNNRKFRAFTDEYFDALLDELNRTKSSLIDNIPKEQLKEEADILYRSSLGYL